MAVMFVIGYALIQKIQRPSPQIRLCSPPQRPENRSKYTRGVASNEVLSPEARTLCR